MIIIKEDSDVTTTVYLKRTVKLQNIWAASRNLGVKVLLTTRLDFKLKFETVKHVYHFITM